MKYDYFEHVKADVLDWLEENSDLVSTWGDDRDGLEERLNDILWNEDSVTGNGSGSYTFSSWKAEEYLAQNWALLSEALEDFGMMDKNPIERGAEWCDVTIRCYLLGQALHEALDEYLEVLEEEEEEGGDR